MWEWLNVQESASAKPSVTVWPKQQPRVKSQPNTPTVAVANRSPWKPLPQKAKLQIKSTKASAKVKARGTKGPTHKTSPTAKPSGGPAWKSSKSEKSEAKSKMAHPKPVWTNTSSVLFDGHEEENSTGKAVVHA